MRRIGLIVALALGLWGTVSAQTSGQFCIKAFEDRNGNGTQDAGEPVLSRGLSINLLNESGVVVQSAVLENSQRAAFGEHCFQFLAAGQYSVVVTGADYTATTPDTMTAAVTASGAPVVMPFGGQRITSTTASSTAAPVPRQAQLEQIVVAFLAALLVIAMMVVIGVIVYLVAFRGRMRAAVAADARRTTGSMRTVRITDTGEFPEEDTPLT